MNFNYPRPSPSYRISGPYSRPFASIRGKKPGSSDGQLRTGLVTSSPTRSQSQLSIYSRPFASIRGEEPGLEMFIGFLPLLFEGMVSSRRLLQKPIRVTVLPLSVSIRG